MKIKEHECPQRKYWERTIESIEKWQNTETQPPEWLLLVRNMEVQPIKIDYCPFCGEFLLPL